MSSGTINLARSSTSGSYIEAKVEWSSVANNSTNKSNATGKLYVRKGNDSLILTIPTGGTWNYSLGINGQTKSGGLKASVLTDWVLLETLTVNDIAHGDDGKKNITISASVTAPSGTSFAGHTTSGSKSVSLDTIPRASTITSASNVTLGNKCSVSWTPASASFRYKIKFSIGNWSYTTGAIHPNTTAAYAYTAYTIPLDVANQISKTTGSMTATLYTYSDSAATKQVGSASAKTFTVTVPNNASTKPTVGLTITPINSNTAFNGLYIQGKTKVKGVVAATGKYSATIKSTSFTVEGKTYASGAESSFISGYGNVSVVANATDSREFPNSVTQSIYVYSYANPKLSNVTCERCDSNGNASESGTCLRIKASRSYTPIMVNGAQKNYCTIQYRYKAEGGSYSPWLTLLASSNLATDTVDSVLTANTLSTTTAYVVQVGVVDTIGSEVSITFDIESEEVYMHRRKDALGLGKYTKGSKLLDVGWDANFDGKVTAKTMMLAAEEITVGGDPNTYYPVHIKTLSADNSSTIFLGLGKMFWTQSGDWADNHSQGYSSLTMGWIFRYNGWDGSGYYIEPLYKCEPYAKLIAHMEGFTTAIQGVVLYLRGGGGTYKIACSVPVEINVYTEQTNLSTEAGYDAIVSPRGYTGNYGILQVNAITSDFVVETGTSGIWTYRKWYSGLAECWGKKTGTVTNLAKAWGNLYVGETYIDRVQYPFTFTAAPNEQAKVYTQASAVILFAESAGSGVNTTTHTAMYNMARGNAVSTSVQYTIDYYVTGRYK